MQIFDGNYDEIHDWIVRGQGVAEAAVRYPGRFIPLVYLNPLEGADTVFTSTPRSRWQSASQTFILRCPACRWA